jgi:hypothetical protein
MKKGIEKQVPAASHEKNNHLYQQKLIAILAQPGDVGWDCSV